MNKASVILSLLVFFLSCDDSQDTPTFPDGLPDNTECIQPGQNAAWETEPFKTDYTIQFPDGYEGGIGGFEGNTFDKSSDETGIRFYYFFCSALFCEDFGDTLASPIPDSLITLHEGQTQILHGLIALCENNDVTGLLYYNDEPESVGEYYMKVAGQFRHAVTISFPSVNLDIVLEIIKTIRHD